MSLLSFQTAFAALIRNPSHNRQRSLSEFLAPYDLSVQERQHLSVLAKHRELNKYGREQALQRWEQIRENIGYLFLLVEPRHLRRLWFKEFEPRNLTTEVDNAGTLTFSRAFLEFLLVDPTAKKALRALHAPRCLGDLLKVEIACIELMAPVCQEQILRKHSLLTNKAWRILELEYDVSVWLELVDRLSVESKKFDTPRIKKRHNYIALVRRDTYTPPSVYEIDSALYDFLNGEIAEGDVINATSQQLEDIRAMRIVS